MKRRSAILSVMLRVLVCSAGVILLCALWSGPANSQLSPPFPWDTTEGRACIDQWMSYAAARLNAFNGSANYNGNKPYRFNRYGVLEGRSFHSVAAPDDLRNYNNNVHAMVWAWYNPGRPGWGPMYELASVEPVQGHVSRCLGSRTGTGSGTGSGTGGVVKPCPNGSLACGFCLGSGIYNKWIQFGGERGMLDCPVMDEADAKRSSQGTGGRYAEFRGGDGAYIFWHATGRLAYQSVVVRGCMFRLFRDAGTTASWLGFPLGDEYAVPGGQRQDFEGGYTLWNAQTRACQAYRAGSGDKTQFCRTYAQTAVSQNDENLRRNCGYTGSRWQSSYDNHYSWCMGVEMLYADAETSGRSDELKRCGASTQPPPQPPQPPNGPKPVKATCTTHIAEPRRSDGIKLTFECPPNCTSPDIEIDGTDLYSSDSSICKAAIHAGRIDPKVGGIVTIETRTNQGPYTGSTRNGVQSMDFSRGGAAYVFVGGQARAVEYSKGRRLAYAAIPAKRSTPTDVGLVLEKGRPYFLVSEGVVGMWSDRNYGVDSVYRYDVPAAWGGKSLEIWGQLELFNPNIRLPEAMQKYTGRKPDYNPSHVYETVIVGEGQPLRARVYDTGDYGDNSGELRVTIYEAVGR